MLRFTAKITCQLQQFHLSMRKTAVTSNSDLNQLAPMVMAMLLRLRRSLDLMQYKVIRYHLKYFGFINYICFNNKMFIIFRNLKCL